MTNKELIRHLQTLPPDAVIMRQGDEYKGDERRCVAVTYREDPGFGTPGNSILIN